ncbi:MAG: aldehyde dehydrogenase family protein [Actinobacteria bacterium]|nr:aldehyde dehydrogenase family protein [Actinomycetota bacterium]
MGQEGADAGLLRLLEKSRAAQAEWAQADQRTLDRAVREIARTVYDNAEELARLTVEETKLGGYEFNLEQDRRKAEIIWNDLRGKKSVGIINRDEALGLVEIAKPIGVVGAVLPLTIPVTNTMSNGMFSLKCGNAVIFAPHPRAKNTVRRTLDLVLERLGPLGVPANLLQMLEEPSIELTRQLMSLVDVTVATGGVGMVKSAYSSGKPAYGVGPGNVQAIIDRGADFEDAVEKIISSRTFNLGLPCGSEQATHVPQEHFEEIVALFVEHGAAYFDAPADVLRIQQALFDEKGAMRGDTIGITAAQIAAVAGLTVAPETRMLLLKGDFEHQDAVLRKEKLSPVGIIYAYERFEDALEIAHANLNLIGKGHSAVIHSSDAQHIEQVGRTLPVSRVIVNQACNFTTGGAFNIAFTPTTTLGCGFWGNTLLSENLTYKHLMNVTRIGYPIPGRRPSSEEIWALE